ncbi:MAG: AAC(3) family N-acetyltransferase [Spirochaetaceae bacterium]
MYNKQQLEEAIKQLGIKPTDTILIHSSMKSIGDVEGGADTVIDLFTEYMKPGLLIFPTHTWNIVTKNGDIYDPETTPSCIGILTNIFKERPNVIRSLHPTHSVAAIGKNAQQFTSGEENATTPAPWDGCWGKLYSLDAKILFLGCSLNRNTFIHSVEEWCNIPNRLSKDTIDIKIKEKPGNLLNVKMFTHKAPVDDISANYGKLKKTLLEKGIAEKGYIGDAECYLCNVKEMADVTKEILEDNPDFFLYK